MQKIAFLKSILKKSFKATLKPLFEKTTEYVCVLVSTEFGHFSSPRRHVLKTVILAPCVKKKVDLVHHPASASLLVVLVAVPYAYPLEPVRSCCCCNEMSPEFRLLPRISSASARGYRFVRGAIEIIVYTDHKGSRNSRLFSYFSTTREREKFFQS